jgi:hypothetical protein
MIFLLVAVLLSAVFCGLSWASINSKDIPFFWSVVGCEMFMALTAFCIMLAAGVSEIVSIGAVAYPILISMFFKITYSVKLNRK